MRGLYSGRHVNATFAYDETAKAEWDSSDEQAHQPDVLLYSDDNDDLWGLPSSSGIFNPIFSPASINVKLESGGTPQCTRH